MVKQQGSLGFTLRKEDESVLGHYVRALVRPPATDGIIKPGDKIVAVSLSGCEQAAGDIIIKFSERSLGSLDWIITSHVFVPSPRPLMMMMKMAGQWNGTKHPRALSLWCGDQIN